MKSQTELYEALDQVYSALTGETLRNTVGDLESHIEIIRQTAETAMIVGRFSDVALDIIKHYAGLADELLADIRCVQNSCASKAIYGLSEPEAEFEEGYHE